MFLCDLFSMNLDRLQSSVELEGNLLRRISQEERNLLLFARFLPWNGRYLERNDRICFTFPLDFFDWLRIDPSVRQVLLQVLTVLKTHLETPDKETSEVLFIQENVTSPPPGPGFAGQWHVHFGHSDGLVVHFGDGANTELLKGVVRTTVEDSQVSTLIPPHEVEAALFSGTAEKISLGSGEAARITDETVHKRGEFVEFSEPRMAVYVKFKPRIKPSRAFSQTPGRS